MEIPPQVRQLDEFLLLFEPISENQGYNRIDINKLIAKRRFKIDQRELDEILFKLEKDGYLRIEKGDAQLLNAGVIKNVDYWILTFEGELFQQKGGYTQQIKDINALNRNKRIQNLVLTYGTGAAGAYGVFEIAKWFYHHFPALQTLKFWP